MLTDKQLKPEFDEAAAESAKKKIARAMRPNRDLVELPPLDGFRTTRLVGGAAGHGGGVLWPTVSGSR